MSDFFQVINYIGTFVFAVTGASIAAKIKFDLFGMIFLAFLTAVGGGTVRDIIIETPVFWTENSLHIYLIFAATIVVFYMQPLIERHSRTLLILDTLGVGTFVAFGTHKTLTEGFNIETALIMGTISPVLGGILRAAFSKEFSILANKEFYATMAACSSLVFIITNTFLGFGANICAFITVGFTFALRFIAIKFRLQVPTSKTN